MNIQKNLSYLFYLLFALFIASKTGLAQTVTTSRGLKAITAKKVKSHIDFLASDALLGRNTPSAGLDTAAAYIAREFKKYGLQPVNGSYFSPVPLVIADLGDDNSVEITAQGVNKSLIIKTEFVPFENTVSGSAEGTLVFVGYGISTPEYNSMTMPDWTLPAKSCL
jgi:hypothetical protein